MTITVYDQAPAATADIYDVAENGSLNDAQASVLQNDYDPDGDALTATLMVGPTHAAAFALNPDGTFSYTPLAGYTGTDSFSYEASDGTLSSSSVTVSLNVTSAPLAANDYYYLPQTGSLTVAAAQGVLANDFDSSITPLQAVLVQGPSSGSLTLNTDGSFTYTPGGTQTVTFQYAAQAGPGGPISSPVLVTLVGYGQVPTVTLERVAFLNGETMIPDDESPAPIQAQWLSSDTGNGDSVAYTRDTVMTVQAVLQVSDPRQFQGPIQVQGQGGGLLITGTAELDDSGNLVLRQASVQLPDVIQALEPLRLAWQVLPAGGQNPGGWLVAAGISSNLFYEAGGTFPQGMKRNETVVAVGTRGAAGQNTDDGKITGIWKLFQSPGGGKPPQIKRKDGQVLLYYGSWTILQDIQAINDPNAPPLTTASLLKYGDGECIVWTYFFFDVLASQGVTPQKDPLFQALPITRGEGMLINNWKALNGGTNSDPKTKAAYPFLDTFQVRNGHEFSTNTPPAVALKVYTYNFVKAKTDVTKQDGIAGQGNPNPKALFGAHTVAQLTVNGTTLLYDPSYGQTYTSLLNMDQTLVAFYGSAIPNDAAGNRRLVIRANPAALDLMRGAKKDYSGWKAS